MISVRMDYIDVKCSKQHTNFLFSPSISHVTNCKQYQQLKKKKKTCLIRLSKGFTQTWIKNKDSL